MIRSILLILTLCNACMLVNAQDQEEAIRKGNDLFKQQKFAEAEQAYTEVISKEANNETARFNLTVAAYRQNKNDEAIKQLNDLTFKTLDKDLKANSYYNKGVILSGQKKLEESIEAYKSALRLNPKDQQARENLQKALLEQKKNQPPPPKKEDKKKKQDEKKQQQQQPKMNQKEAQQRLKLLEQKEKDVQQRLQKEKSKQGGGQAKDW